MRNQPIVPPRHVTSPERHDRARAFTLLELLVAIGIITLLIGILIPTIGRVRTAARQADTRAQIATIAAACESYYSDFRAYPGPFSNDQIANNIYPGGTFGTFRIRGDGATYATTATGFASSSFPFGGGVTSSENLVLGLLGGLVIVSPNLFYDATLVGKGANSLNSTNPKKYGTYMDPTNLSLRVDGRAGALRTGKFGDDVLPVTDYISGGCSDTIIPEFVDRFANPLPILYVRARTGANGATGAITDSSNPVVSDDPTVKVSQYDLINFLPYTNSYDSSGAPDSAVPPSAGSRAIGVGKTPPTYVKNGVIITTPEAFHGLREVQITAPATSKAVANSYYPLPAFPYLRNPSLSGGTLPFPAPPNIARNKDNFILISAGTDRIYGTADDITNFGDVLP